MHGQSSRETAGPACALPLGRRPSWPTSEFMERMNETKKFSEPQFPPLKNEDHSIDFTMPF